MFTYGLLYLYATFIILLDYQLRQQKLMRTTPSPRNACWSVLGDNSVIIISNVWFAKVNFDERFGLSLLAISSRGSQSYCGCESWCTRHHVWLGRIDFAWRPLDCEISDAEAKQIFNSIDSEDGTTITIAQLYLVLRYLDNQNPVSIKIEFVAHRAQDPFMTEEKCEELVHSVDENNNGRINSSEVCY